MRPQLSSPSAQKYLHLRFLQPSSCSKVASTVSEVPCLLLLGWPLEAVTCFNPVLHTV